MARRAPVLLALGPGCIGMNTLQKWNEAGVRTGRVTGRMYRSVDARGEDDQEWEVSATVLQRCSTCSFELSATFVSLDDSSLDFTGDLEFVSSSYYYRVYGPSLGGGPTYWGGGNYYSSSGTANFDWGEYYTAGTGNGTFGYLWGSTLSSDDS